MKAKRICDLSGSHGVRKILFVGKDEKGSIAKLVLVQHLHKLRTSLDNTITIIRVDNEDDTLRVLEVYIIVME